MLSKEKKLDSSLKRTFFPNSQTPLKGELFPTQAVYNDQLQSCQDHTEDTQMSFYEIVSDSFLTDCAIPLLHYLPGWLVAR